MSESIVIDDVKQDVARVQNFDTDQLVQKERLGEELAFSKAAAPAVRLISIFSKLPVDALTEFPHKELTAIQRSAKETYNLFDQIMKFNPRSSDAEAQHERLVTQLGEAYQPAFTTLFPYISFAIARTVDFNELASQGRVAVQSVRDETKTLFAELQDTSKHASAVLNEVRGAAAEQGVTQQAKYFADESNIHAAGALLWQKRSVWMAVVVVAYAVATLFFPKFAILSASTTAEAIQLTASKALVFVVLSYVLFICVKNFNAHNHNAVVNKHRQNALMTYKTLAEAGNSVEARDTVLQHAAAAIYAPNDSGYLKAEARGYGGNPVVGFSPKSVLSSFVGGDGA